MSMRFFMSASLRMPGKYVEGRFVYEGEFFEDVVTGTGKFSYPSGASYEGQWVNGLYNGQGKYSWPDGRHYEVREQSRVRQHCAE